MASSGYFVMKLAVFTMLFTSVLLTPQVSSPYGETRYFYQGFKLRTPYICTEFGCLEMNVDVIRVLEKLRNNEQHMKIQQLFQDSLDNSENNLYNNAVMKRGETDANIIPNPPCDYCNGLEQKLRLGSGRPYFPDNISSVICKSKEKCEPDGNFICTGIKHNVTLLTPKVNFHTELKLLALDALNALDAPLDYFTPIERLYDEKLKEVTIKCVCLSADPFCEDNVG